MATEHHTRKVTRSRPAESVHGQEERVVEEVVTTDDASRDIAPASHVGARVVRFIGGAVIGLLTLRLVLALLGANRENPFAAFVFDLSNVFVWPFFGLFAYEPTYGVSQLELGTIVAIIVYALITSGVARLFTITRR